MVKNVQNFMKICQKGPETVRRVVIVSKININGLNKVFKLLNGGQNIAFWTNTVSYLHHEIKAVNIWLLFIRFIRIRLKILTS